MWWLLSIKVEELSLANLSKGVHDVPVIVLWNGKLIQLHYFGSTVVNGMSVVVVILTYKVPFVLN